jgi:hypothetical protein
VHSDLWSAIGSTTAGTGSATGVCVGFITGRFARQGAIGYAFASNLFHKLLIPKDSYGLVYAS